MLEIGNMLTPPLFVTPGLPRTPTGTRLHNGNAGFEEVTSFDLYLVKADVPSNFSVNIPHQLDPTSPSDAVVASLLNWMQPSDENGSVFHSDNIGPISGNYMYVIENVADYQAGNYNLTGSREASVGREKLPRNTLASVLGEMHQGKHVDGMGIALLYYKRVTDQMPRTLVY